MRALSSGSHVSPMAAPDNAAVSMWKVLVAAALLVPPSAYVAGVLTSAADEPVTREALLLPGAPASVEPRVVLTRTPEPREEPTPPASPPRRSSGPAAGSTGGSTSDCDDDGDDDGVDVIRPCPDDLDDDRRAVRDDDDDDRDDDDDDGDDD